MCVKVIYMYIYFENMKRGNCTKISVKTSLKIGLKIVLEKVLFEVPKKGTFDHAYIKCLKVSRKFWFWGITIALKRDMS